MIANGRTNRYKVRTVGFDVKCRESASNPTAILEKHQKMVGFRLLHEMNEQTVGVIELVGRMTNPLDIVKFR